MTTIPTTPPNAMTHHIEVTNYLCDEHGDGPYIGTRLNDAGRLILEVHDGPGPSRWVEAVSVTTLPQSGLVLVETLDTRPDGGILWNVRALHSDDMVLSD